MKLTSHNTNRFRTLPCLCGSGKKFKRCCLRLKPKPVTESMKDDTIFLEGLLEQKKRMLESIELR